MSAKEQSVKPRAFRIKQVVDYVNISRSQIYSMMAEGTFPKGAKVNGLLLWDKAVLDKWVEEIITPQNTCGK